MDFNFKLPGLGKPESARPKRVAEAMKQELNLLLLRCVADPRLAGVQVTKVEVSSDLKSARVYVRGFSPEKQKEVMAGMHKARGFFRSQIAKAMNLRYTPEILPYYDNLAEEAERVEHLLYTLEREREEGKEGG